MSVKESFVMQFGEVQAQRIEEAAIEHKNGVHDRQGSDPFKWACLIVIGFQCVEVERYRQHHSISVPFEDFKKWCKEYGELSTHDGDCDFLALMVGVYKDFLPDESAEVQP